MHNIFKNVGVKAVKIQTNLAQIMAPPLKVSEEILTLSNIISGLGSWSQGVTISRPICSFASRLESAMYFLLVPNIISKMRPLRIDVPCVKMACVPRPSSCIPSPFLKPIIKIRHTFIQWSTHHTSRHFHSPLSPLSKKEKRYSTPDL